MLYKNGSFILILVVSNIDIYIHDLFLCLRLRPVIFLTYLLILGLFLWSVYFMVKWVWEFTFVKLLLVTIDVALLSYYTILFKNLKTWVKSLVRMIMFGKVDWTLCVNFFTAAAAWIVTFLQVYSYRLRWLFRGFLATGYIARYIWLYSQELYSQI